MNRHSHSRADWSSMASKVKKKGKSKLEKWTKIKTPERESLAINVVNQKQRLVAHMHNLKTHQKRAGGGVYVCTQD